MHKIESTEHSGPVMLTQIIRQGENCSEMQPEAHLHALVVRKLKEHPYFRDCVELTLEFEGSVVIVKGRLPSFYLKQVLQELLKKMPVVSGVTNQVEVTSNGGHKVDRVVSRPRPEQMSAENRRNHSGDLA